MPRRLSDYRPFTGCRQRGRARAPVAPRTSMIPSYRHAFNSNFTSEKYERLRREMTSRCGMEVPFALCETPCFFPNTLVERMGEDGKALIRQLVENPEYRARSEASIPAKFRVPNESPHPMFIQVDFGLERGSGGGIQPNTREAKP